MKATGLRGLLAVMVMASPLASMAQQAGSGAVALTGPGAGASEDFGTLASAHGTTSSVLPAGWYFLENPNANSGTYAVDDGTANSGNTYSYGSVGSGERALGALASGSVVTTLGAQLRNDSGATVSELAISYFVEQWRLGSTGGADTLSFAYSTDATALNNGTWTPLPALDAVAPVTTGTASQKLDGNLAANRAQVSGTISGLSLAPNAVLWVRWADVNDQGSDDGLAIDDLVFGTPVDVPPTLVSSYPIHNATDFPANAALTLTFSEPVDVSGTWFEIQCASSGYRNPSNVLVSGGPTQYFLTPATAFTVGESCDLTLDTDFIVDQGANAYPLADPGTIHFTTVAPPPNVLPSVTSTVPSQNATNFPSAGDLMVTFSEPVTAASGAFSLTCDASTGIVLAASTNDGGVNFTIGTGTALVAGDSCHFTIHAAAIIDLDGGAMATDVIVGFSVMVVGDTSTYYEKVNLASPQMLRCSLHETIKSHSIIPYGWTALEVADEAPPGVCAPGNASSENYILDIYRNRCYQKVTDRSNPVDQYHYNREHSWPKSLGFNNSSLAAHNDLHMLHLSASDHNGTRDNDPYDNCAGAGCSSYGTDANNGVGGPGPHGNSNWSNGSVFEVWDEKKGDMARAMFYMAIRYEGIASEDDHDGDIPDLELTDDLSLVQITPNTAAKAYMGKLATLLDWHRDDQPDMRETQRTGVVQLYQGNRNPFVDHPEWVSPALFQSTQPATCVLNHNAPAANDDSYSVAQGGTLTVAAASGVLLNDSDTEGAPISAQDASAVGHGTLALAANGGFSYTPQASFCGTDSFSYRTSDGTRLSAPATVTIAVGSNCGTPLGDPVFKDGFED